MNEHIDGDALARAPLSELENMLDESPPGSNLRKDLAAVFRVVAVCLIAGEVPEGMTTVDSVCKGRDLLALLNSYR